jgi:Putative ABC exporter
VGGKPATGRCRGGAGTNTPPTPALPREGGGRGFAHDLRALLYLDGRLLANRARLILHDPRRLLPWLLVLGWIGSWRLFRVVELMSGRRPPSGSLSVLTTVAPLVPGLYLAVIGVAIFRAAGRAPVTFRSPADARFLIGSRLPPRLVIGWLQLRRVIGMMVVSAFNVLLVVAFLPVAGDSPSRLGLLFLAVAGAYVTLQAAPMAVYLVGRRRPGLPLGSAGVAVTVLGGLSLTLAVLQLAGVDVPAGPAGTVLAQLPPGEWVRDAYHGHPGAVALVLLLAGATVAFTVRLSGDAYPELWESSSRLFTLRRLARQRGGLVRSSDVRRAFGQLGRRSVASVSGAGVPGGAGAILWKEWLALRRTPGGLLLQLLATAGALGVGAVVGLLAAGGDTPHATSLAALGGAVLVMVNVYAGMRLGAELRNPVWWLSAASLRERLLAWTVAATLRQAVPAVLGAGAALAIAGDVPLLVASLAAVPAAAWLLRMVGLAAYAIVPSQTDLRGPGRMLRMLLLGLTLSPPALVLTLVLVVVENLAAGALAATVVMLAEGWLLLELAAWLLRRNGLGYARAEAR